MQVRKARVGGQYYRHNRDPIRRAVSLCEACPLCSATTHIACAKLLQAIRLLVPKTAKRSFTPFSFIGIILDTSHDYEYEVKDQS